MSPVYVSNCQAYAWKEYRRRYRIWAAAGYHFPAHPWVHLRPSKSKPHGVLHAQVGGGGLPTMEFVPIERRDVSWWMAWTRLFFHGRERPVEFPTTEPSKHGQLE